MEMPGPGRFEGVTRISSGIGYVRERTLELGPTIIALENIATMLVVARERSFMRAIVGVLIAVSSFFTINFGWLIPTVLVIVGFGLVLWNLLDQADVYLLIGTSDGRRTNIVSKNLDFLVQTRDFIRQKLDSQNLTMVAAINITKSQLESPGGR
ncbi:MAG: DUF6232 family protein [Hyphomonadaceae bacterium]